jgi:hypothetical protein
MTRRSAFAGGTAAAMMVLLACGTASGQVPVRTLAGTAELGAFVQWSWFDAHAGRPDASPVNGIGYGGRAGFFLTNQLQLEADGYYSPQARSTTNTFCCTGMQPTEVHASAFALRMNYNFPYLDLATRPSQIVVGAGGVRTNYAFRGAEGPGEDDVTSFGASVLAGLRIVLADHGALRLDGVADYHPTHEPEANLNLHARAGLSLLLGGARPAPLVTAPPPVAAPPRPAPTPATQAQTIQLCVVQDGQLRMVTASVAQPGSDTTVVVDGQTRRFRDVHPGIQAYATGRSWFVEGGPIRVANRQYVRFGLTRVIQPAELTRIGEHQGVPVFAAPGQPAAPDVVYLPVRPGCEFQPYQLEAQIQVRG